MTKNILVSGASGFLGSHVTEELVKNGFKVVVLKRSATNTWRLDPFMQKIVTYNVDRISICEIFRKEGIDCVFHLAAYYKKYHVYEDIEGMTNSNLAFPTKLIEAAANNEVKLFVNCGSYFEYKPSLVPIDENSARIPHNLYSASKLAFENIIDFYTGHYDIKAITLMLFTPYGERDNPSKLIPALITKSLKGETVKLSEGYQKLDFTYAKDIANAFLKTLDSLNQLDQKHEFVNIATGVPHSIRDVVSILQELSPFPINVEWGEKDMREYDSVVANVQKASRVLGWTPLFNIKEGLKRTVSYYAGGFKK